MNTAEYLIKRLETLGINDFFGLPGDYNFNLLYAIEDNPNTNWVGCTNELNAGYAADGYARKRGYGALITTYGVGELSAVNAIAGAMAENVPVVHIVGLPATKSIKNNICLHHNFQQVDYYNYSEVYKSVTAGVAFLTRDNAKLEIDRVLKILVKEKKPVYIAVPLDIAKMDISDKDVSYDWTSNKDNLKLVIEKFSEKINESKKPVIIGDVLIKRYDATLEYREFVTKTKIPVTNFFMGANLINMDYEYYLGPYCGTFANKLAEKFVNNSDCLISVGPIYSDLNSFGFSIPVKLNKHIAIYGNYTYVNGVKYDDVKMADVLEGVLEFVKEKNISFEKNFNGYETISPSSRQLTSEYLYSRLQEFLKENDTFIVDMGTMPHGIATMKFPINVDVQTQSLWGSIGWATPATLGMTLAKQNSRVILLTGDGAHQLTAMEVGNMLRLGVKPIIIVLNNKGYSIERVLADNENDFFNDIVQMNYSKFARIFEGDVWSTRVNTEEDFDKALRVTQIMNKMCYIELCMDPMELPELTKNLVLHLKSKINKNDVVATLEKKEDVKIENKISYETVVHKGISEE